MLSKRGGGKFKSQKVYYFKLFFDELTQESDGVVVEATVSEADRYRKIPRLASEVEIVHW
jgi:hypothetical protein